MLRPPSPALASALVALLSWPDANAPEQWAHAIEQVAEHAHPEVAFMVAPLALVPNAIVARAAARTVGRVLEKLDATAILHLSTHCRTMGMWRSRWQDQWAALRPDDIHKLAVFGDDSLGPLCMASVHPSGYVRHACVDRLSQFNGRVVMAFLLVRTNDWVRPVRASALRAVLDRAFHAQRGDEKRANEVLDNIVIVDRISQWGRGDHDELRNALESVIAMCPFEWILDRAADGSSFSRVLSLLRRTVEAHAEEPFVFLERTISSLDARLRSWAAREITRRLSGEPLRTLVDLMVNDSFAPVRYEAVFAIATKLGPVQTSELTPFLHDPDPNVRFLAAYYLGKKQFDVRSYYLRVLPTAADSGLTAIVTGIGEHGKAGDEAAIAAFLEHPSPHVRRAAVFTTGKLRPQNDWQWLVKILHDPHKLVAREAGRQIENRVHIVDLIVFERWFHAEQRLSLRRDALRIGAKLQRWMALEFLLRIAPACNGPLAADLERELWRCLRGFVDWYQAPTREQLRQVDALLDGARAAVDPELFRALEGKVASQKTR
ncbi:MAG TPA: HEAT repeat domain-containing protein [Polyangium sp.]|nr:HEAT repeat domain-containing protein [Polyangium sp.]